jgi:hypothetical protein
MGPDLVAAGVAADLQLGGSARPHFARGFNASLQRMDRPYDSLGRSSSTCAAFYADSNWYLSYVMTSSQTVMRGGPVESLSSENRLHIEMKK